MPSTEQEQGRRLHNQAILIRRAGGLDKARALYQEALRIKESASVPSETSFSYAQSLDGLGLTELAAGNYLEAHGYFQRSLEIYKRILHPADGVRVDATTNLIEVANACGNHVVAFLLAEEKEAELVGAPDAPLSREDCIAILNLLSEGIIAAEKIGEHSASTRWKMERTAIGCALEDRAKQRLSSLTCN